MDFGSFMQDRTQYFKQLCAETELGKVLTSPTAINLNAGVLKLARSKSERTLVRELGGYEIMRKAFSVEDITVFQWSLPSGEKLILKVQLLQQNPSNEYLCLYSTTKAWYAIAQVWGCNDPMLLAKFFSSPRAHDKKKFGFAVQFGPPEEITNCWPDRISGSTVMSMYGHWLRWASRKVARGSGVYSLLPWNLMGDARGSFPRTQGELDSLKRMVIAAYRERKLGRVSSARPKPLSERSLLVSQSPSERRRLDLLLDRHEYLSREAERTGGDVARSLWREGKTREAIQIVENLVSMARTPETRAHYLLWLGSYLEGVLDFEWAVTVYGEGIALEPRNKNTWYYLHNNMGCSLNRLGRFKDGEWYCQAARTIDRTKHHAYKNLGVSFAGQGEYARAVDSFAAAIRTNPGDPQALRHLEDLVRDYGDVLSQITGVEDLVAKCREVVRKHVGGRRLL